MLAWVVWRLKHLCIALAKSNAFYQGGATVSLSAVEIYNDIALGALAAFQIQAELDIDTL